MHGRRDPRVAVLKTTGAAAASTLDAAQLVALRQHVSQALAEDIGAGDVTAALVPATQRVHGHVVARESGVLCGREWFNEVFAQLCANESSVTAGSQAVSLRWHYPDGARVAADTRLVDIDGPARVVLTGERTALNFLQTLSATATAAARYVDAIAGTGCRILDTRKTLPGLRLAQKYAARCGGAQNHRLGLHDMVLIKENHIIAAGSIEGAINRARELTPRVKVEIEVESLAEFERALAARPDIIMLDELTCDDMRTAVARNRVAGAPCKLEASGNVTLATVRQIAETGVDFISVGGITKHIQALDLSMRLEFSAAST